MMNPKMFLLLLLLLPICSIAQSKQKTSSNPTDIYAFRITNSSFDFIARDYVAIEDHIEVAIYPCSQDLSKWCFANRRLNEGTSSYGELNCFYSSETEATDTTYKNFLMLCDWYFYNDYDNNADTAELFIEMNYLEAMTQVTINCYWDTGRFTLKGYALNTEEGKKAYQKRQTKAAKNTETKQENTNVSPKQKYQADSNQPVKSINYRTQERENNNL